jgi:hypothetical protein
LDDVPSCLPRVRGGCRKGAEVAAPTLRAWGGVPREPSEMQPVDAEAMQPLESIRKMDEAQAKAVPE